MVIMNACVDAAAEFGPSMASSSFIEVGSARETTTSGGEMMNLWALKLLRMSPKMDEVTLSNSPKKKTGSSSSYE